MLQKEKDLQFTKDVESKKQIEQDKHQLLNKHQDVVLENNQIKQKLTMLEATASQLTCENLKLKESVTQLSGESLETVALKVSWIFNYRKNTLLQYRDAFAHIFRLQSFFWGIAIVMC